MPRATIGAATPCSTCAATTSCRDSCRRRAQSGGVDPAPKARRRLGTDVLARGGRADERLGEVGRLHDDVRRRVGDFARRAAHDPRQPDDDVVPVADQKIVGRLRLASPAAVLAEDPLDPVEGDEPFALMREADAKTAPAEAVEVVGVGRLSAFEHRVVRRVDDGVDRPHPRQNQPALHVARARKHRHPRNHPRDEPPAGVGCFDGDRHEPVRGESGLLHTDGRHLERNPAVSSDVARHAHHRQQIGAVRLDVEIEDGVVLESEVVDERLAEWDLRRHLATLGRREQDEDAAGVGTQAELAPRTDHPFRTDAAHLAAPDLQTARQAGPDPRERDVVADLEVERATDDRRRCTTGVDDDLADPISALDRLDLGDTGDDDAGECRLDGFDVFDVHPEHRKLVREVAQAGRIARIEIDRREILQPRKRHPHGVDPFFSESELTQETDVVLDKGA